MPMPPLRVGACLSNSQLRQVPAPLLGPSSLSPASSELWSGAVSRGRAQSCRERQRQARAQCARQPSEVAQGLEKEDEPLEGQPAAGKHEAGRWQRRW